VLNLFVSEETRHVVKRGRIRAAGEDDLGEMVGEDAVGQSSVGGVKLEVRPFESECRSDRARTVRTRSR
jgi:hypothetical protein